MKSILKLAFFAFALYLAITWTTFVVKKVFFFALIGGAVFLVYRWFANTNPNKTEE